MKCTIKDINELRTLTLLDRVWQVEFCRFSFDAKSQRDQEAQREKRRESRCSLIKTQPHKREEIRKILFVPFVVSCGHQIKEPRMTPMSRIKKNVLSESNKDVWLGHSLARKED